MKRLSERDKKDEVEFDDKRWHRHSLSPVKQIATIEHVHRNCTTDCSVFFTAYILTRVIVFELVDDFNHCCIILLLMHYSWQTSKSSGKSTKTRMARIGTRASERPIMIPSVMQVLIDWKGDKLYPESPVLKIVSNLRSKVFL